MNYNYIESSGQLESCIAELAKSTVITIDLEFDKNRFRYGFNLCLMQIFDGNEVYLIDPLPDQIDISKIFPLLENPDIQKVCFSFGEDLRLLHSLGCFPKNIYDIQFTAALLNHPPSSLAKLLEEKIEIQVSKSSQDSNWFARPLSEKQKNYAAEDVCYLFDLKQSLVESIQKSEIQDWIAQENENFADSNHEDVNHNVILKERYKNDMTEFEWHIFGRLMELREELAQEMNRPPFHLAERITLENLAKNPSRISDWKSIKSNHKSTKSDKIFMRIKECLEESILDAEAAGLSKKTRAAIRLNREEYLEMKALDQKVRFAKEKFFRPIQNLISEHYGEHTKTFILSNRLIKDLVIGDVTQLLPYKRTLISTFGEELQLDLSPFLKP